MMNKEIIEDKKMTIDDLAVMMTSGFESVYKEIAEGREETNKLAMVVDGLAVMATEGREETNELARMVANGFSSMDKKFSDKFEVVDKRFDAIDKRFEAVDKRFEAVDKRFDEIEESIATTNSNVLSLGDRTVPRFEFDQHLIRFNNLEQRVAVK